jgi:hypothetical protein
MAEDPLERPRWTGESLAGRSILLRCEQGFGDSLQFIRYARILKRQGATVYVLCREPLARIIRTSESVDRVICLGDPWPQFDVYIPLVSVPSVLGTTLDNVPAEIPYLEPNSQLTEQWKAELSRVRGLKVGISWHCDPEHPVQNRRIPLAQFSGIARTKGVQVYSLQFGAGREELAEQTSLPIIDLGDRLGDFHDTGAIVRNLDLVITCDSAPVHLAGALGIPVWVVLPFAADWRWMLDRSDSPWYPTMRLFRQSRQGDWQGVFAVIDSVCFWQSVTASRASSPSSSAECLPLRTVLMTSVSSAANESTGSADCIVGRSTLPSWRRTVSGMFVSGFPSMTAKS